MENEKSYLTQVINSINNQISECTLEIAKQEKESSLTKDQITMNFYDMDEEELSRHKVDLDESEKIIDILKKNKTRLENQVEKPYFARIDFSSNNNFQIIYIGLGYIKGEESTLVYDWRAPISSMYYDFDLGPANYNCEDGKIDGTLTLKRQYSIENQKLNYYIDTTETINDEILLQVLSNNTSSKMKEIVSTIQKEQNKLIRCDDTKNILVQGVAGSGKTSIALHRAGYLLYKNKATFSSNDIFILSPSNLFSNYISNVLPELGENNVIETTFLTIAKSELDKKIQSRDIMLDDLCENKTKIKLTSVAYKSSFSFLEDLLNFLQNTFSKTFRAKDLNFYSKENESPLFSFTKEEIEKLYYDTYKNLDISKRISYTSEFLIERFNLKKKEFLPIKKRFSDMLYNFFPTKDIQKILNLFLSTKNIEENDQNIYHYDDIPGLLIIKDYLFGLNVKIPAKYIIIDEMQDFTPAHFYLFNKLWECPKLLLGDINQCIEKNLTPEYLDMLSKYMNTDLINLNKTYRSTKQIAEFCQKIIGLKNVVNMCRDGESPNLIKTENQIDSILTIISNNINKYKHIAIVCKTSKEVNSIYNELSKIIEVSRICDKDTSFNHQVLITTATTSKGIEFDYVIIPNVDKENYNDGLDRNLLYIAGTRALHKLTILYTNELSPLIKLS